MAKVICENCGAEIVLPENSMACFGECISEKTPGTYILRTKKNSAHDRMEALRNSGADMSKYFEVKAPNGDDMIID